MEFKVSIFHTHKKMHKNVLTLEAFPFPHSFKWLDINAWPNKRSIFNNSEQKLAQAGLVFDP